MHSIGSMSPALLAIGLALSLPTTAIAQQVTVDLTALTPLEARVDAFGQVTTDSLPAGPMPAYGHIEAVGAATSGVAIIDWFQAWGPDQHDVTITSQVIAPFSLTASSSTGPFEVLIELAATAPTPVEVHLAADVYVSAGTPAPRIDVDVDNDGGIDFPDLPIHGPGTLLQLTLDTQPLALRVIMASQTGQSINTDQSTAQLRLSVRPQNLVQVTRTATSCTPVFELDIRPVFEDRGIDFVYGPPLYVFGMNAQPVLLQPQAPLPMVTACLLMPSPDVLIFAPFGYLHLPLPPAVRPAELHVQGVSISGAGWTLSDAYRINAF